MASRPLVMKFGGTSVADAEAIGRVVTLVRKVAQDGPVVVVVSAMSRVTDRLLGLAAAAERRAEADIPHALEELRERHLRAIAALVRHDRERLESDIAAHLADVGALLTAASILKTASPSALDAIASTGELLSSRIVTAALESAGLPARWIDPRAAIVTDANYTAAAPITDDTTAAVTRLIGPALESGRSVVVGGYVGATRQGVTTTLGRGGSDYSAAIVGAALGAREIQIWTDVDGMLTADPRVVADTRVVPRLSFDEASELAYFGAKVLHPSTILPAVANRIPVRILNSHRPEAPGTLITPDVPPDERTLAAIACKRGVTTVDITSTRMLMAHGFLRRVFEIFERERTSVDVVTTSEVSVSVTVDDDGRLDGIVEALREFADVSVERGMAIVCAVGDNLRQDPRIAARVVGTLDGFPIRMVSQAASRRNVTIVLRDADVPTAMTRLHKEFFGPTVSPAPRPGVVDEVTRS